jgi:hypothetical protein
MNTIQKLIEDIEKFDSKVNENKKIGPKWNIKKKNYLDLINQILSLKISDFENGNKYNSFLKFIKNEKTTFIIEEIADSFIEDHLDMNYMLKLGNLFIDIIRKLK